MDQKSDQDPEFGVPCAPTQDMITWGAMKRTTQHLPSTLRAAGGTIFVESSGREHKNASRFFSLLAAASGSPRARVLASARGGINLCLNWVSRPTQVTRVSSNDRFAEANHQVLFRATSSNRLAAGPHFASQPKSFVKANPRAQSLFSIPPSFETIHRILI